MEVKIDESDVKTLKIMQKNIEDLQRRLGIIVHQYERRKEELVKAIEDTVERRYDFMQTIGSKYELETGKRWEFNEKSGCFESEEVEEEGDKECQE